MKRRQFLKGLSTSSIASLGAFEIVSQFVALELRAQTGAPVDLLVNALTGTSAMVLRKNSPQFGNYQSTFNIRTELKPEVRVVCGSAKEVARCLEWAQTYSVPFALRGGGHSYEGHSQSLGLVIDVRGFKNLNFDPQNKIVEAGAGHTLGQIYSRLTGKDQIIPAGSCPDVGVSGHVLGGGIGLLAHPLGLACDSLLEARMVDSSGQELTLNSEQNSDLFWAIRGGGQGSFGVLTSFKFKTHSLKQVITYKISFSYDASPAAELMGRWQEWLKTCPREIMSIFVIVKSTDGRLKIDIKGQSTGGLHQLQRALKLLVGTQGLTNMKSSSRNLTEAVQYYGGSTQKPEYMKGRSDVVTQALGSADLKNLMKAVQQQSPGAAVLICDSYGGAIADVDATATAFPHRKALYGIQWASFWQSVSATNRKMLEMKKMFEACRASFSGASYLNYPDAELKNYARSYWQHNLEKLVEIKNKYDSKNIFRHPQSVPIAIQGL